MQIRDFEQENYTLREILTSRGIPFEGDLPRKGGMTMGGQGSRGMSPSYSVPQANLFTNTVTPTPLSSSAFPFLQEPGFSNGALSSTSGHSPMGTHHSNSPSVVEEQGPMIMSDPRMPDMPGVFEKDPQLGIDFILAYVNPNYPWIIANRIQVGRKLSRPWRVSCPQICKLAKQPG